MVRKKRGGRLRGNGKGELRWGNRTAERGRASPDPVSNVKISNYRLSSRDISAAVLRDSLYHERRLAFAVIHRAIKDIMDYRDKAVSVSGLTGSEAFAVRKLYNWIISSDLNIMPPGSFAWWANLAQKGNPEKLIENSRRKSSYYYQQIQERKTSVDN